MNNAKKTYEQKRDTKRVSFNIEKESELLEFANSVDFSNWVKDKIKAELSSTTHTANKPSNRGFFIAIIKKTYIGL